MTRDTSPGLLMPGHRDRAQAAGMHFAFQRHDDPRIDDADDFPIGLGLLDVMREADKSARQYFDRGHAGHEYIHHDIRLYELHSNALPSHPGLDGRLLGLVDQLVNSATSGSDNSREDMLIVNELSYSLTEAVTQTTQPHSTQKRPHARVGSPEGNDMPGFHQPSGTLSNLEAA